MSNSKEGRDEVVLQFPAESGYLSLCRVNATAVGSMLGFDIDTLDDLRLAVTEAVTWNLDGASKGTVCEVRLRGLSDTLELSVDVTVEEGQDSGMDDLASAILGAMVDDFSTELADGRRRVTLRKSMREG